LRQRFDVLLELGPALETIFACDDALSGAQREFRRLNIRRGEASELRMELSDTRERFRMARMVGVEEILGLMFEMVQARTRRQ
jgi:hypothetical protein